MQIDLALDSTLNRCLAKWRAEGIALAPPIIEAEVVRVWNHVGMRASDDVIQLYATVGGFEEYSLDETFYWCLWPWDYLKSENSVMQSEGIQFCDQSIDVVRWELHYEAPHQSSVWLLVPEASRQSDATNTWYARKVAPGLESFFQMYLDDPWRLM